MSTKPKSYAQPNRSDAWLPVILDDVWNLEFLPESAGNQLSGKNLYVDVWASWCRPCLQEMEYKTQTDSLLAAHDIERLYISIDKQEDEAAWFNKVFGLNLGGYHVRAGQELTRQLKTELGFGSGPIPIPRFLFVKNGQIIDIKAARPSDFKVLRRQVERYFPDR
jgi:thiol-disulfide isomerase/thioredoxin